MEEKISIYTAFETEFKVRPDDIDMNQHVHSSRYMDYVLAARYEQMEHNYKMPMEEFIALGYGWVINSLSINYKRPLVLGDFFVVKTNVCQFRTKEIRINFEILKSEPRKLCCDGWIDYTMVSLKTGRAEIIPDSIIERYSI